MTGGLIVETKAAARIDQAIQVIRAKHKIPDDIVLKFSLQDRPKELSQDSFNKTKGDILDLLTDEGCALVAACAHFRVISKVDHDERITWSIDEVLSHFQDYLTNVNDTGICIFDRIPIQNAGRYLDDKHRIGLTYPNGHTRKLDRIVGYSQSGCGQSHLMSAADITIGSLGRCTKTDIKPALLEKLAGRLRKLITRFGSYLPGSSTLGGLITRPNLQRIKSPTVRREFQSLASRLGLL